MAVGMYRGCVSQSLALHPSRAFPRLIAPIPFPFPHPLASWCPPLFPPLPPPSALSLRHQARRSRGAAESEAVRLRGEAQAARRSDPVEVKALVQQLREENGRMVRGEGKGVAACLTHAVSSNVTICIWDEAKRTKAAS